MTQAEIMRNLARAMAPQIADNNKREQEALMGYYALLRAIDDWAESQARTPEGKYQKAVHQFWLKYLTPLKKTIEEIIADELNHSHKLNEMMAKFGMVRPATD